MSDVNRKIVRNAQTSAIADTVTGLFSTLADTMPQMVWATDANGSHFYFNRRWYEYTGLSVEESMGFGFATILHPDDVERTLEKWRAAWAENADYEIEYRFRRADGVYRWFVGRAMPVRAPETEQVTMWVGTCTDIDDTRRAYDALRESQGRLAVAIQSARLGLWEYEFATNLVYYDAFTRELFGLTEDRPYTGAEITALVHEDDRRQESIAVARAVTGEDENYHGRYRIRRADKTIRYAQAMAARFTDETGTIKRLVGVVQDVTETQNTLEALRESADALRESESLFRSVVTNAPIVVFMLDQNGVITLMEGAALRLIDRVPGQNVGVSAFALYDDLPEVQAHIRHALSGEVREWVNTFNGVTFETHVTPMIDTNGEQDGIVGVSFDITERSKAAGMVRESEERFRTLVEATSQIVWSTRASGVITRPQPNWAAFTGQSWDEHKGSGWMNAVHKEDREATEQAWKEAIAGKSVYSLGHRLRRADGEYRHMSVRAVPVLESSGAVREWIGVHTDITEQKEAELALEKYASQQAKVAETLQRSLLNTPPARAFAGLTVSTHYVPALEEAQVGGDFFDVFALAGGKVAFVLGDVTGKGIQAAEHTGQIKYALRAFLRENGDPGNALRRMNRMLCDARVLDTHRPEEDVNAMAAVVVCVLDNATGQITVAGGGAESPLVYNSCNGAVEEVRTMGTSVGAYEDSIYEVETRRLKSGDLLLMATDGITEARRGRREFFGIEGFARIVEHVAPATTEPEVVAVAVIEAARAFSNNGVFRDDVCLLAVRRD